MNTARFALSAVATSLVLLVMAPPSAADENAFGTCPDGYTPVPFVFAPDEDRNGNGVVCVKPVDAHVNTKDDPNGKKYACNGFPVPPPECADAEELLILDDAV
jgi:hypothetical protein